VRAPARWDESVGTGGHSLASSGHLPRQHGPMVDYGIYGKHYGRQGRERLTRYEAAAVRQYGGATLRPRRYVPPRHRRALSAVGGGHQGDSGHDSTIIVVADCSLGYAWMAARASHLGRCGPLAEPVSEGTHSVGGGWRLSCCRYGVFQPALHSSSSDGGWQWM
jgi:hypothetical protein